MPAPDDDLRESMAAHKAGSFTEAEAGYRRVLAARPADPKALYYLGLLQFHRGDTEGAIELVRRCLSYAPSNAPAWNTLGGLYIAAGCKADAREAYGRATLVAAALARSAGTPILPAVLDAGCGTGLCGPLVRERCASLVGVDLSPQMIEHARARACYDELVVAELSAGIWWLRGAALRGSGHNAPPAGAARQSNVDISCLPSPSR